MRIKVFSFVEERDGKPPLLDLNDGANKYRVRVFHDGATFELAVDAHGRLNLREVEGRQLTLQPSGSNEVYVAAEKWR